jgi:hypothetical protein
MVKFANEPLSPLDSPVSETVTFSARHTYHAGEKASNPDVLAIVREGSRKSRRSRRRSGGEI